MVRLLRENLGAMYSGTNQNERRAADKFLQRLQRDSAGWGLADAILGGRTSLAPPETFSTVPLGCEALVFAAMTLHVKVQGDLHELSEEQQTGLRDATIAHLSYWASGPAAALAPSAVVKKLALAVAALAVQTAWEGVLHYVEARLGEADDATSSANTAEAVVRACRVRLVAIELLTALPEQCCSRRLSVNRIRRDSYNNFLATASGGALAVMTSVVAATSEIQRGMEREETVRQAVNRLHLRSFVCLYSWMRWSNVSSQELAQNQLFLGAFEALGHGELFDVAADVIVGALQVYDCSQPENLDIVQVVAPRIMGLRQRFEACADEADAYGFARLFCEMGESYWPLIASPQNASQMLAVVDIELSCARHSSRRVSGLALRFFYHLTISWKKMREEDPADAEAKAQLHRLLVEPFSRLVDVCLEQARRTDDDGDIEQFGRNELGMSEEFARHRQDVADALIDCTLFVRIEDILQQHIHVTLVNLYNSASTQNPVTTADGIEACLFALRAVAQQVPNGENVVLPFALRLILQWPPGDWPATSRAGAAVVGAYAGWLRSHTTEFLEPLFSLLVAQLETTAARNAARAARNASSQQRGSHGGGGGSSGPSVSAKSLKAVCVACRKQLAAIPNVVDLRDRLGPNGVALRDEQEVLEGLAHVVAASTDFDSLEAGFERLVQPPAAALAEAASQSEPVEPKVVIDELDRLTSIVRCTMPDPGVLAKDPRRRPHPVLTVVGRLWPVFEALADRYRGNSQLIERLCRCYKHSMRSCQRSFEPMLSNMISHLVRHFAESPLSSYVYASSICITEFGKDATKRRELFEMVSNMSATVFSLFSTVEDFRDQPDIVEEYFYLVSRYLDYCPDELVASPLLGNILRCGVVGLTLEHRETQRSVLHCFERTVAVALQHQQSGDENAAAARNAALRHLLVDEGIGSEITGGVLKSLVGELPAYALDDRHGSLTSVLFRLRAFCPAELPQWCANVLASVPERFASNDMKHDLLQSISTEREKDAFCRVSNAKNSSLFFTIAIFARRLSSTFPRDVDISQGYFDDRDIMKANVPSKLKRMETLCMSSQCSGRVCVCVVLVCLHSVSNALV